MAKDAYQYFGEYEQRYFEWAGISVVHAQDGTAEVRMPVAAHHRGGGGTSAVNGGIGAYVFDGVLGAAVRSTWDPAVTGQVTMTLSVQYLRPLWAEHAVVATGRVTHRGASTVYVEGEIRNDDGAMAMTAVAIYHLFHNHGE